MATLVVRNIDASLHTRLKEHARAHGHSMEEEVRQMLRERLATGQSETASRWVDAIRSLFEPIGGLKLPEVEREPLHAPPDLSAPHRRRRA